MDNQVRLELKAGISILFSIFNGQVEAAIESKDKSSRCVIPSSNLSCEKFMWMAKFPSIFIRKLFINYETLQLSLCPGLLGSGACAKIRAKLCCKGKVIDSYKKFQNYNNESIDPSELENKTQQKASELAKKIQILMKDTNFDEEIINQLSLIKPHLCEHPYAIADILLKYIDKSSIWNCVKIESAEKVVRIMRKFYYAYFIKNKGFVVFTSEEKKKIKEKLSTALKLIDAREEKHPRISTSLDLKIIIKLVTDAKSTEGIIQQLYNKGLILIDIISDIRNCNLAAALRKIANSFKETIENLRMSFQNYQIIFETYSIFEENKLETEENKLETEENKLETEKNKLETEKNIEDMLKAELQVLDKLKTENIIILIDNIIEYILQERVSNKFISTEIFDIIEKKISSDDWKIRAMCAKLLKNIRLNKNKVISEKALSKLHNLEKREKNSRVLKIIHTSINALDINIKKKIVKVMKFNKLFYEMIDRDSEVQEIHKRFEKENLIILCGNAGSGKTWLGYQYCEYYYSEYRIIYQINSNSIDTDINDLNSSLSDLQSSNKNKTIHENLQSIKDEKILIFLESEDALKKLYIKKLNIKYLYTSRDLQSRNAFILRPLDDRLVKEFLLQYSKTTDIDELVNEIKGWPNGIRLALLGISKKNFKHIDDCEIERRVLNLNDNNINSSSQKENKDENKEALLKQYNEKFEINEQLIENQSKYQEQEEMIARIELLTKELEINKEEELKLFLNLAAGYKYIQHDLEKLKKILEKIEKFCSKQAEDSISTVLLKKLSDLYDNVNEFKSEKTLEIQKQIYEEKEPEKVSEKISTYFKLAEKYENRGFNNKVENCYRNALNDIERSSYRSKSLVPNLQKLADFFIAQDDLQIAQNCLEKSVTIQENNTINEKTLSKTYSKLADLYKSQKNLDSSEKYYLKSLEIDQENSPTYMKTLKELGDLPS